MQYCFDTVINREQTHSVKFDGRRQVFGTADLSPLWVADMDFAVPDCVSQALAERAAHPVFGYTLYPESLYQSLIDWFQRRHQWHIEREWILMAPGVVPSLNACCLAFAQEGEGVLVQPPVYFPFFSAVTTTQRQLILNPLILIDGRYHINFTELEALAAQAKLLMLCTPHNPVGRVWSRAELLEVLRIAKKFNLIVLSDDIHADLTYPSQQHIMLGSLEDADYTDFIRSNVITAVAPSKTFNIPGLGLSSLIVPNPEHRKALQKIFELLHINNTNPFSIVAYEAAYNGGDQWLDELRIYLNENKRLVRKALEERIPQITFTEPEGTYLLWLNCSALGLSDTRLRDFFVKECQLGLSPGIAFGQGGSGYMRLNIGTRSAVLTQAMSSIEGALAKRPQS